MKRLVRLLAIPLGCQKTTTKWLVIIRQNTPGKSLLMPRDSQGIDLCDGRAEELLAGHPKGQSQKLGRWGWKLRPNGRFYPITVAPSLRSPL
jgi:hypothetical protein